VGKKPNQIELIEPRKALLIGGVQTQYDYFESLEDEIGAV